MKRFWKYLSNALLVFIVLILFIPSWRLQFQTISAQIFMGEAEFEDTSRTPTTDDFPIFNVNDELTNFRSLEGKPIVLTFWRTWCAPCRAELPELKELKNHFQDKIHLVSLTNESFEIINEAGVDIIDYPFIRYSPYDSKDFKIEAFPTLFLLDAQLKIVSKITGGGNLLNDSNISLINSLILES